jgi:hypothetical protein
MLLLFTQIFLCLSCLLFASGYKFGCTCCQEFQTFRIQTLQWQQELLSVLPNDISKRFKLKLLEASHSAHSASTLTETEDLVNQNANEKQRIGQRELQQQTGSTDSAILNIRSNNATLTGIISTLSSSFA